MTKIFNIDEVTPEEMLEPVDTLNTIIEQLNDADIPDGPGGESYTLPVATSTTLGGIKAGEGLTVAADGTASVDVPEPAEPLSFSGGLAESDGTVTAVLGAGLSLVNGAITALGGGEGGGGGDYVLPVATADALGGVKVATSGPITIGLDGTLGLSDNIIPTASDTILGGIKVGDGLTIDDSGVLSVDDAEGSEYVLPVATADELGGVKVASSGPITIAEDGTLGVSDDIIPTASTTVLGGVKAPVNNFPAAGTPASLEIAEDGTINAHIATANTAGVLKIAGQGMDIYATSYNPVYMDRDQNQAQEISPFFVESDAPWDGEGSGGRLAMVTSPSFMHDTITYTDSRTGESVTRTALGLTPASIAVLGGVKVTNEGGLMMNDGVLSANLDPDTMILKNGKISAVGGGGGNSQDEPLSVVSGLTTIFADVAIMANAANNLCVATVNGVAYYLKCWNNRNTQIQFNHPIMSYSLETYADRKEFVLHSLVNSDANMNLVSGHIFNEYFYLMKANTTPCPPTGKKFPMAKLITVPNIGNTTVASVIAATSKVSFSTAAIYGQNWVGYTIDYANNSYTSALTDMELRWTIPD